MSRENVEIAVRAVRAAIRRPKPDFEVMNELFAPDHVLVPFAASKFGEGEVHGGAGYRDWLKESNESLPWESEFEGAVDVGSHTVLVVTANRFRAAQTGIDFEQRFWMVMTLRQRRITRSEAYLTPDEAIDALAGRRERR